MQQMKRDDIYTGKAYYNTVFAEINAHPEINAHQKQSFFTGGST